MPDLQARNYTGVSRIDRRLYALGDWVLPVALPFRGIGFFALFAPPIWIALSIAGVELTADTLAFWIGPPAVLAAFAYKLRPQGKSFLDVITAHLSFAWWWVRNASRRRARGVQLQAVLWRPTHSAYRGFTRTDDDTRSS